MGCCTYEWPKSLLLLFKEKKDKVANCYFCTCPPIFPASATCAAALPTVDPLLGEADGDCDDVTGDNRDPRRMNWGALPPGEGVLFEGVRACVGEDLVS